ncbi:MAG TPA: saccharopine dehydrogenase C-terminal domain-containing protein, partial [Anaerolineales bacterium]|nr:saccharopine dehydrogenase C-terminal domain-containing protein [Anaerolineales bacterium]
ELTLRPMIYENGQFQEREPMGDFEDYWFSAPIGLLPMHLSLHSEVATLPVTYGHKGVQECFFKINYWGMAKETVEKIRVLADFGFGSYEAVKVGEQQVIPRDLMIALLSKYVPPITDLLAAPKNQPPDWVKEIVTEVQGTQDGKSVVYRVGTLTCKGALPTGVAPAITAIWLAEGRIPPGVHPPEAVIDPEPFFEELKRRQIVTNVSIKTML